MQWLFIPSEERLTALSNSVTSKFDFVDSIKYSVSALQNIINNVGNAPKLVINLDHELYSGPVTIIDLNWYSRYKSWGDLILTGFIYAMFLWRLFIKLPSIISGTGGAVETVMRGDDRR